MKNEIIDLQKANIVLEEGYINSTDLVTIINECRKEEFIRLKNKGLNKKDKVVILQHCDLMKKIKNELEILKSLGLEGDGNFSESSYVNSQNKTQPCYKLNRDGMLQILNSESTIVRALTIKYINQLEQQNKELKEDNKALYEVATADEDLTIREYEANKVKFAVRNIDRLLSDCDYTNIEKTVDDILDFHTNKLKKKDRYEYYRQMSDTEYKQLVRKKIKEKLDKLMINRQDLMLTMVAKTVQLKLENEAHTTTKKSTSHKKTCLTKKIDKLEQKIDELTPVALSDMYCCNYHPFSWNYALKDGVRTDSYNRWLYYFPYQEFPSREDMEAEGIDFSKPIRVILRCVHLKKFDTTNLSKSFIDAMFNNYRGVWRVDDCIVRGENLETVGFCDSYKDGKMYWYLENFDLESEE